MFVGKRRQRPLQRRLADGSTGDDVDDLRTSWPFAALAVGVVREFPS